MNILLTGATGFLGKQITDFLAHLGHRIIISCRDQHKLSKFSPAVLSRLVIWDINELHVDEMIESNPKIDVIIHAATDYGRSQQEPTGVFWANEVFPMTLLEKAIQYKIPRFINMDTFFNYKDSNYQYLRAYSLSKRHFQEWAEYYGVQCLLSIINVKLFHLFGPDDDLNKYVPMLITRCLKGDSIDLTEGTQERDFIYSADVVRAIDVLLHANLPCGYHHYDVGRGETTKLRNFATLINKLCGNQAQLNFGAIPTREGEPMHVCAKIDPLLSLGWMPEVSLQAGLTKVIEGQRS